MLLPLEKRHYEFLRRHGKKIVSQDVLFIVGEESLSNEKDCLKTHRLGFSISKKCGNNVIRNRLRRIFRTALDSFNYPKPLMIQVILKKGRSWSHAKKVNLNWSQRQCQVLDHLPF